MTTDVQAASPAPKTPEHEPATLAQFTLLYESRDKRFCLFEDAEGHLAAVDASKLA